MLEIKVEIKADEVVEAINRLAGALEKSAVGTITRENGLLTIEPEKEAKPEPAKEEAKPEPAPEPVKEESKPEPVKAEEPQTEAEPISASDLFARCQKLLQSKKMQIPEFSSILQGFGVKALPELTPEQRAQFAAQLPKED